MAKSFSSSDPGSGDPGFPAEIGRDDPSSPVPPSAKGKLGRLFSSLPVIVGLLLLLLACVTYLSWSASRWKGGVTVRRVVVEGTRLLPAKRLEKQLHFFVGRVLDTIGENEVYRLVGRDPLVRSVAVSRELNGILRVRVDERRPVAATIFREMQMVVDDEGVLIPDAGISSRFHRMPTVQGVIAKQEYGNVWRIDNGQHRQLSAMIEAFRGSEYAGLLLHEIRLEPGNRSWFLVSGSSIRFILGNEGNFKEKLKKFEIFWQKVVARKGFDSYATVDLRFRERVFTTAPFLPVKDSDTNAPDTTRTGKPLPR